MDNRLTAASGELYAYTPGNQRVWLRKSGGAPLPSGRLRLQARRAAGHDDLVMAVALASWDAVRQWPALLHQDHPTPQPPGVLFA